MHSDLARMKVELQEGLAVFAEYLAAGLTAIVIALVTVPMYRHARRGGKVRDPAWSLGRWGHPVLLGLAVLATVLMAAGSLLEA
jgi:hypothetical protein